MLDGSTRGDREDVCFHDGIAERERTHVGNAFGRVAGAEYNDFGCVGDRAGGKRGVGRHTNDAVFWSWADVWAVHRDSPLCRPRRCPRNRDLQARRRCELDCLLA